MERFETTSTIDRTTFAELKWHTRPPKERWYILSYTLCLLAVALIGMVWGNMFFALLGIIAGVGLGMLRPWMEKRNAIKIYFRRMQETGSETTQKTVSFTDEEIKIQDVSSGGMVHLDYQIVERFAATERMCALFTKENQLIVVNRRTLTERGEQEAFIHFIREKCVHLKWTMKENYPPRRILGSAFVVALVLLLVFLSVRPPTVAYPATLSERTAVIIAHDGYVFFQSTNTMDLYRRSPNGAVQRLAHVQMVGGLHMDGDVLYHISEEGILKINLESGAVQRVSEQAVMLSVFHDGWMYGQHQAYDFADGWVGEIFRIRPDGSGFSVLSEDAGTSLQLYDGQLYYFELNQGALMRMDVDGSNAEVVLDHFQMGACLMTVLTQKSNLRIYNGWVYYINRHQELYRIRLDGQRSTRLREDVAAFDILGRYIVLLDYEPIDLWLFPFDFSSISMMRLDGRDDQRVIKWSGWIPIVAGDYFYWYVQYYAPELGRETATLWRFHPERWEMDEVANF